MGLVKLTLKFTDVLVSLGKQFKCLPHVGADELDELTGTHSILNQGFNLLQLLLVFWLDFHNVSLAKWLLRKNLKRSDEKSTVNGKDEL